MRRYRLPMALILTVLCSSSTSRADDKTTVRIQGAPQGTFQRRAGRVTITNAQATARNVGSNPATDVKVTATLPGGHTVQLDGPTDLAPNKSALYSITLGEMVISHQNISASASCGNCR